MSNQSIPEFITTLMDKVTSLKTIQKNFVEENYQNSSEYSNSDTPNEWIIEDNYQKNSRMQRLINKTEDNLLMQEIIELINKSNDLNIIWKIEKIYKVGGDKWDKFLFCIFYGVLDTKRGTIESQIKMSVHPGPMPFFVNCWKKWDELHKGPWIEDYKDPQ